MKLFIIDIDELIKLDTWNVPAVPRAGEVIEMRGQNWRINLIKWVKSNQTHMMSDTVRRLLNAQEETEWNEIFAVALVSKMGDTSDIDIALISL